MIKIVDYERETGNIKLEFESETVVKTTINNLMDICVRLHSLHGTKE